MENSNYKKNILEPVKKFIGGYKVVSLFKTNTTKQTMYERKGTKQTKNTKSI